MLSTRHRLRQGTTVVLLAVVVGAPAAASWRGLVGFAEQTLGLSGAWLYLVPLVLDGAALYAATLAMRAVLTGDSAIGARVLTVAYAVAAAGFNGYHALHHGGTAPALFFAGASLSAVVLWDATLRMTRRDQLRERGLVEAPLPRFRAIRWAIAPLETARAWRIAVLDGLTDPAEALATTRAAIDEQQTTTTEGDEPDGLTESRLEGQRLPGSTGIPADRVRRDQHADRRPDRSSLDNRQHRRLAAERLQRVRDVREQPGQPELTGPGEHTDLGELSKADAVRHAFDELGERDIPAALTWLTERGVTVNRAYAYTVNWSQPPALQVVGGEQ